MQNGLSSTPVVPVLSTTPTPISNLPVKVRRHCAALSATTNHKPYRFGILLNEAKLTADESRNAAPQHYPTEFDPLDENQLPSGLISDERKLLREVFHTDRLTRIYENVINYQHKIKAETLTDAVHTMMSQQEQSVSKSSNADSDHHQGHVHKLPFRSREKASRFLVLRDSILQVYKFPHLKEALYLKSVRSVRQVIQTRADNSKLLGIELVLQQPTSECQFALQPDLLKEKFEKKRQRTYTFGVHSAPERDTWMVKILQSVVPCNRLNEYTIAGWAVVQRELQIRLLTKMSKWEGAWLVLTKRTLHIYSNGAQQPELLDLRKARKIEEIKTDKSDRCLCVASRSLILIDCPPSLVQLGMFTVREVTVWKNLIDDSALDNNGASLDSQQLTKDNVPVVIDKCVNFICAYGADSEKIYHNPGCSDRVNELLYLFSGNAFAVILTRSDFNEHDVASGLLQFVRGISNIVPEVHMNRLTKATGIRSIDVKIKLYKEVLSSLTVVEYSTLQKLIDHLRFIASREQRNKMGIFQLAIIWGSALCNEGNESMQFAIQGVVVELIVLYRILFAKNFNK